MTTPRDELKNLASFHVRTLGVTKLKNSSHRVLQLNHNLILVPKFEWMPIHTLVLEFCSCGSNLLWYQKYMDKDK